VLIDDWIGGAFYTIMVAPVISTHHQTQNALSTASKKLQVVLIPWRWKVFWR